MNYLHFNEPLPLENIGNYDLISFSYHINNFDYPEIHGHADYWEFTIVTNGAIENVLNGKSYFCPKGTLFFATTKDTHCLKKASNEKPRYINIIVREVTLLKILNAISPDFKDKLIDGTRSYKIPDETIINIESIIHKANITFGYKNGYNELICSAVLLILQFLYLNSIEAEASKPTFETDVYALSLNESFLSYKVSDLCDKLNYSRVQLNRLFKQYFSMTPHEYLIERKLNYAKSLLANTTMASSEIAEKIGFSNLSQFNVDFNKLFGTTPGAYRKANYK